MNIALWIVQGLLGAAFIVAGLLKAAQPKEKLPPAMTWTQRYSAGTIKLIGVAELLGGLGLILPWATGIAPILTPIAATGLALVMVLAALDHIKAKEYSVLPVNVVLGGLALFVAIGRF